VIKQEVKKVNWRKRYLWLQLVVNSREMHPKEKFLAQPYSLHTKVAENLSSDNEIKLK
jgi:hypothetical protein